METRHYWEENGHTVKYDNYNSNDGFGRAAGDQLNFAAPSEDEAEYPPGAYLKKGKVSRQDPMSHRIIEKRRRDRMNNCLADLSRLIPPEYLKKGRGRVEKTEIIEMAIRHLKYLQDRANAAERHSEDSFRAGYQEAVGEAVRYLVEVQGYVPGDGVCVSMASHLQRHIDAVTKGERHPREKARYHAGSSSETASSSSSSQGYVMKPSVIQAPPAPPPFPEPYEAPDHYSMDCDRVSASQMPMPTDEVLQEGEPMALDGRRKRSPSLRTVRKPDHTEDYLHSYKFKNSIERRFSRSQDNEACDMSRSGHNKMYSHKRRRGARPPALAHPPASTSTSASVSTEETIDTSPQDTSSESTHHHHYEKPAPPTQYVPVFALNAIGKYYVPLSVESGCLARQLGACGPVGHVTAPLHPVTIHVNFQPCLAYHLKRETPDRDWRPA